MTDSADRTLWQRVEDWATRVVQREPSDADDEIDIGPFGVTEEQYRWNLRHGKKADSSHHLYEAYRANMCRRQRVEPRVES